MVGNHIMEPTRAWEEITIILRLKFMRVVFLTALQLHSNLISPHFKQKNYTTEISPKSMKRYKYIMKELENQGVQNQLARDYHSEIISNKGSEPDKQWLQKKIDDIYEKMWWKDHTKEYIAGQYKSGVYNFSVVKDNNENKIQCRRRTNGTENLIKFTFEDLYVLKDNFVESWGEDLQTFFDKLAHEFSEGKTIPNLKGVIDGTFLNNLIPTNPL